MFAHIGSHALGLVPILKTKTFPGNVSACGDIGHGIEFRQGIEWYLLKTKF
jgi:hypothetical protein